MAESSPASKSTTTSEPSPPAESPSTASPPRWRTGLAITMIVLGCVLAVPAVAMGWVNQQLTQTDAFVTTVAPIIDDPQVQRVITTKITDAIFDNVDLEKFIEGGIDSLEDAGVSRRVGQILDGFNEPLAGAIRGFVDREIGKAVASDAIARLWRETAQIVHAELTSALSGDDSRTLRIRGDELIANTGILSAQIKDQLIDRGLGFANVLPTINADVTVLRSSQLTTVQRRYQEITLVGTVLPWIAGGLIVGGIAVAIRRRAATVVAGVGVAIAMVTTAAALSIGGRLAADAIPSDVLPTAAASSVIDTVLRTIWRPIWFYLALGLVVAMVAWFAGPARPAQQARALLTKGIAAARAQLANTGLRLAPVDGWVRRARQPLMVGVVVVAALAIAFWPAPTWTVVLWLTLTAGLFLLAIAFLGAPEPAKKPAARKAKKARARKATRRTAMPKKAAAQSAHALAK